MMKTTSKRPYFLLFLILIPALIIVVYPFLYMISTTFKVEKYVISSGFNLIPDPATLKAYKTIFSQQYLLKYFQNSSIITFSVVAGNIIFAPMAAYAFAKKQFVGKNVFFIMLLSTLMIPYHLTLIPSYKLFNILGWMNKYQVAIVPFLITPLAVFMMRQYIASLPTELEHAARIDGCTELGIYWKIIFPLVKPALAVMIINTFMSVWNNFVWPFMFLSKQSMWTVTVAVANFPTYKANDFTQIMVMATLAALPTAIIFLIFQKQIISGLTEGAIKG